MVRKGQSSVHGVIEANRETKSTVYEALKASATFRPLDIAVLSESYAPSMIYSMMLAMSLISIRLIYFSFKIGLTDLFETVKIGGILSSLFIYLAIIIFGSFISSLVGCYIIGKNHSAKYFMLIVSSLTYTPLMSLFYLLDRGIGSIISLGFMILNGFYLSNSYSKVTEYPDTRIYYIHYAWIIVSYLILTNAITVI